LTPSTLAGLHSSGERARSCTWCPGPSFPSVSSPDPKLHAITHSKPTFSGSWPSNALEGLVLPFCCCLRCQFYLVRSFFSVLLLPAASAFESNYRRSGGTPGARPPHALISSTAAPCNDTPVDSEFATRAAFLCPKDTSDSALPPVHRLLAENHGGSVQHHGCHSRCDPFGLACHLQPSEAYSARLPSSRSILRRTLGHSSIWNPVEPGHRSPSA
jgi:hypothetical protein